MSRIRSRKLICLSAEHRHILPGEIVFKPDFCSKMFLVLFSEDLFGTVSEPGNLVFLKFFLVLFTI